MPCPIIGRVSPDGRGLPELLGVRYVVPLREGGSLPAVVETAEDGAYVVKFRGAGQGPKALVAETLFACIASALDLPVPSAAIVNLEAGFGRAEPNPEIQDILRGSVGPNFGLAYLAGALTFDPVVDGGLLSREEAAAIVWLDAYLTNVDRTPRNPNLLVCRGKVWMIDHGAALFVHHRWSGWQQRIQSRFPQIGDHVLLPFAGDLEAADSRLRPRTHEHVIQAAIAALPDAWLDADPDVPDLRQAYATYLMERLHGPRDWLSEAVAAQQRGPRPLHVRATHRVV